MLESVKRTAEMVAARYLLSSAVRFTDFVSHSCHPSDESLGYCHSSANADWAETLLAKLFQLDFPAFKAHAPFS